MRKKLKRNKNMKRINDFYTLWFQWIATRRIVMLQKWSNSFFYAILGYDSGLIY